MKYFDYESVAREAKIPPQKMRKLMKICSARVSEGYTHARVACIASLYGCKRRPCPYR